jgi:hypothetical protein
MTDQSVSSSIFSTLSLGTSTVISAFGIRISVCIYKVQPVYNAVAVFFPPKGGLGLVPKPIYVSILRIPQMIWVWRATVEWYWRGKTKELGEKPVPMPLCPPQIPHGFTRASMVRGRWLTTWAMAWPLVVGLLSCLCPVTMMTGPPDSEGVQWWLSVNILMNFQVR